MMFQSRSISRSVACASAILLLCASQSLAIGTQQEVLNGINDSVGQEVDPQKLLAVALVIVALIAMICVVSYMRNRTVHPKPLNSPGKLFKEVCRALNLRPVEARQLRSLAERQQLSNPLVLLLCPSVLAKAMKNSPGGEDRRVLAGLQRKVVLQSTVAK